MQHTFFFDGNEKRIAWSIQSNDSKIDQIREHADIYLNKVSKEQSKFIALHVGLFWSIGRFIIKNNDEVTIMIDEKSILDHLSQNKNCVEGLIKTRIHFINQLINQRKLKINLEFIESEKNYVSKLI